MTFDKAMQEAARVAMYTNERARSIEQQALVTLYLRWVEERIVTRRVLREQEAQAAPACPVDHATIMTCPSCGFVNEDAVNRWRSSWKSKLSS